MQTGPCASQEHRDTKTERLEEATQASLPEEPAGLRATGGGTINMIKTMTRETIRLGIRFL